MPPVTLADAHRALKEKYEANSIEGQTFLRAAFFLSGAAQTQSGLIKRWCVDNKVLATVTYKQMDLNEMGIYLKAYGKPIDFAVVSNPVVFRKLGDYYKDGNQEDWRGSMLPPSETGLPVPVLIIDNLIGQSGKAKQYTVPYFKAELYSDLDKLLKYKGEYYYRYTIATDVLQADQAVREAKEAVIIVADIETNLNNFITSISFTFINQPAAGQLAIGHTYVLNWRPHKSFEWVYSACKKILAETSAYKCFHNGSYDSLYLLRHWIPVYNWMFDTEYMWHAWDAERKKSLAYVASLALPDFRFWKAENTTDPLGYNAKDTINTARVLLWLLTNMPEYAWRNYAQDVPLFCATACCNLEGFATNPDRLAAAKLRAQQETEEAKANIQALLGLPDFNPGSTKQLSHVLYNVLGPQFGWKKPKTAAGKKREAATGKATTATDAVALRSLKHAHPFLARLIAEIERWREHSKAYSTYFNSHLYGESARLYYSLQIDGTKTKRFSCTSSSYRLVTGTGKQGQIRKADIKNYGNQIQNSPPYYKMALCADPGYLMGNADKSKSEAHCVALISGDEKFTKAIRDTVLDFYLRLAEWFFGVETHGNKELPIRQVTKKINHASSYCMGIDTFIDSVGLEKLYYFMELVGWPDKADVRGFVGHLLATFHETFPRIKKWWLNTSATMLRTGGLIETPDWGVRKFWKLPRTEKSLMPDAVAHQPQRLSVVTLNRNMAQVFEEVQLASGFALRLKGQVHDSLVFQYLEGREDLAYQTKAIMERPYETSLGTLAIPIDLELGTRHWKEPKEKKLAAATAQ